MPNSDVTLILTDAEVATLRAGYSNAYMQAGARDALIAKFPRSAPFVNAIIGAFYEDDYGAKPPELGANSREKIVLSILATTHDWAMMKVHVYWALCLPGDPLSPAQIAEVAYLTSAYTGVDVLSNALTTSGQTFHILKGCVAAGKSTSQDVIPALVANPATVAVAAAGKHKPS